ncbi:alpha-L-fucosidase [Paenibacillus sp. GCM10027626]|uniref:alpha-L-fucosidase n=1 Tax=Paenibacillus sp. GCM10027626 TaxID=3273411 RepID=UPI00364258AD
MTEEQQGSQRLSLEKLKRWEALGYGMFIHFGMSTFDGQELSMGDQPSTVYAPSALDVDQWIRVAKEAGMKYAVLTAKHVSGHCLWPSKYTDYHVGTSGNTTDVVRAFVDACRKYDIMPGLYYCSWDNHHLFGSLTPSMTGFGESWWKIAYTTEEYLQFQWNQLEELLSQYGPIGEVWIDIPGLLPRGYRHKLYKRINELQPDAIVMMNHGIGDGSKFDIGYAWPCDIIAIERFLPNSHTGHQPWREIEGKTYYMPGEVCDPIGREWFYVEGDPVRSDEELLGMYLISRSRGTNLLLDVGPDKQGQIPQHYVDALMRLKANIIKVSGKII